MSDRVSALNWVYENHRLQLKSLVRLNANEDPEMEKWLTEEISIHQDAMDRVKAEILDIAYPASEEKEANPKKYPSHRPSCPTDAPDMEPKKHW